MRTITIPRSMGYGKTVNVIVDRKSYLLKTGEEITVQDDVYDILHDSITFEEQAAKTKSNFDVGARVESIIKSSISTLSDTAENVESLLSGVYYLYNCEIVVWTNESQFVKLSDGILIVNMGVSGGTWSFIGLSVIRGAVGLDLHVTNVLNGNVSIRDETIIREYGRVATAGDLDSIAALIGGD